jgi:hypothetical protein
MTARSDGRLRWARQDRQGNGRPPAAKAPGLVSSYALAQASPVSTDLEEKRRGLPTVRRARAAVKLARRCGCGESERKRRNACEADGSTDLLEMKPQDPASWRAGRDAKLLDWLAAPAVRTKQRERRPADPGASLRATRRSDVTCDGPAPADTWQHTSPLQGRSVPAQTPTNRHRPEGDADMERRRKSTGPLHDTKYAADIRIAAEVRGLVPRQRAVLFHGTPYGCAILKDDRLIYSRDLAEQGICLTRQLHIAIYWALLGRFVDEQQGAVFILDRDKLAYNFSLTPFCWRRSGEDKSCGDFEAEEKILKRDVRNLHKYILDVIWLPERLFRPLVRRRNLSLTEWFEVLDLVGAKDLRVAMRRHKPVEIVTKLRQVEKKVSQSETLGLAIHEVGVSEATYWRWKKEYGNLTIKRPDNKYQRRQNGLTVTEDLAQV